MRRLAAILTIMLAGIPARAAEPADDALPEQAILLVRTGNIATLDRQFIRLMQVMSTPWSQGATAAQSMMPDNAITEMQRTGCLPSYSELYLQQLLRLPGVRFAPAGGARLAVFSGSSLAIPGIAAWLPMEGLEAVRIGMAERREE
jgi:hypothetical protein